jgi:glycosyltransferase involved in cell wall biosynthesis
MTASVIVPTYNGARKLPGILQALKDQTYQPWEIIVMVDGSTDNTKEVLENWQQQLPILKIIYQPNQGRAHVRNNGAKAAGGDLLIFFDDDMRPEKNCVLKHWEFHSNKKECILVGNAGMDIEKIKKDDFSMFRHSCEVKWMKRFTPGINQVSLENYLFTTQNLSCPKPVFELIGMFDERLTDSEDFDFSMRAFQKKVPIYFDTRLIAWHDDFISLPKYISRQVDYVYSKQKLRSLKPEMFDMHPSSFSYGQKRNLFQKILQRFFVLNRCWRFFLGTFFFKRMIPRLIRFKAYDLVISSTVIVKMKK